MESQSPPMLSLPSCRPLPAISAAHAPLPTKVAGSAEKKLLSFLSRVEERRRSWTRPSASRVGWRRGGAGHPSLSLLRWLAAREGAPRSAPPPVSHGSFSPWPRSSSMREPREEAKMPPALPLRSSLPSPRHACSR
jgi:hypothetical protein